MTSGNGTAGDVERFGIYFLTGFIAGFSHQI